MQSKFLIVGLNGAMQRKDLKRGAPNGNEGVRLSVVEGAMKGNEVWPTF